jgi:hypothetical protein
MAPLWKPASQQAKLSCLPDCLYAVVDAQFGEDVADMAFDGINDNHQLLRNLLVGCSTCEQLEHLSFSFAQWLWQLVGLSGLFRSHLVLALLLKCGKERVQIERYEVTMGLPQSGVQSFSKEGVIVIPLSLAIERYHKQIGFLKPLEYLLTATLF